MAGAKMPVVTVRKIGKSLAIVLPRTITTELGIKARDSLHVMKTGDAIHLGQIDPQVARQLRVAAKCMRKYRNALQQLAKS